MENTFKEKFVDELVKLYLKLHHPKVAGGYKNNQEGAYKRLKDEIKLEYLKEIANLNPEWDMQELSLSASEKIRDKTNIY